MAQYSEECKIRVTVFWQTLSRGLSLEKFTLSLGFLENSLTR